MCAYGHKMDMQHAMTCKKGGFITIRHNDVWDLASNLLTFGDWTKIVTRNWVTILVQLQSKSPYSVRMQENAYQKKRNVERPLIIKLQTQATKQELIFEREDSGRGSNKHFLMLKFLTQSPIGTSRQHFHNVICKT